tara:strand:+ start:97 stop:267 length:171 start_codon:yes stop_codon:yes gene_type:complete
MSVSANTTSGNTVSVSVNGNTSFSFVKKNSSVSATLPSASSTILTEKSPKLIQVVV